MARRRRLAPPEAGAAGSDSESLTVRTLTAGGGQRGVLDEVDADPVLPLELGQP